MNIGALFRTRVQDTLVLLSDFAEYRKERKAAFQAYVRGLQEVTEQDLDPRLLTWNDPAVWDRMSLNLMTVAEAMDNEAIGSAIVTMADDAETVRALIAGEQQLINLILADEVWEKIGDDRAQLAHSNRPGAVISLVIELNDKGLRRSPWGLSSDQEQWLRDYLRSRLKDFEDEQYGGADGGDLDSIREPVHISEVIPETLEHLRQQQKDANPVAPPTVTGHVQVGDLL